jgi:hypothetical protein
MKSKSASMHTGPIFTYTEYKPTETLSSLPPQGWIKLPNGQSFAIANVILLGETIEEYDKAFGCNMFYFRIHLNSGGYCDCKLYNFDQTPESERQILSELARFRCQIAAARWGDQCIEMKMEEN